MRVWHKVAAAIERDGVCAMVSVAGVRGSAPREAGARLIILSTGDFHGTIGGGALEWEAIATARELMCNAQPLALLRRQTLGAELGQCCGGSVKLLFEVFDRPALRSIKLLAAAEESGEFTTEGQITDTHVVRTVLSASQARSRNPGLSMPDQIVERFGERGRHIYLFGAGHVGRALMLALAPLPFEIYWVDERTDVFPKVVPANVRIFNTATPTTILGKAHDSSFVVVMTHSHARDLDIVAAALSSKHVDFVGLIGSETKRARFMRHLRNVGFVEAQLGRLVCPIGIDGIDSKAPCAIAISVAAQLVAEAESNSIRKTTHSKHATPNRSPLKSRPETTA